MYQSSFKHLAFNKVQILAFLNSHITSFRFEPTKKTFAWAEYFKAPFAWQCSSTTNGLKSLLRNQKPMIKPSIKPLISEVKSRLCKLAKTKFKTLSNINAPLFFGVIISKKGSKK